MVRYIRFTVAATLAMFVTPQVHASDIVMSNPQLPDAPEPVDNANAVVPADVTLYDDTRYSDQLYWDVLTDAYKGRSEIESVHKAFSDYPKESVRVAVLDGGFYNSPDMNWQGGVNLTSADTDQGIQVGDDFRQYDPDTCPTTHGQAVGSIIGATTNNNFLLAGIADVDLYGVRVLGCNGSGLLSEVATGIRWAAADPDLEGQGYPTLDEPVDVINISIASNDPVDCSNTDLQPAINYADSRGVTIVVSAGNDSRSSADIAPGNCDNVMTVAAVDRSGSQANFTNYGSSVDIAAQGVDVIAASGTDGNGTYQTSRWDGTSFSSPIVAGIIAYTQSLAGISTPQTVRDWVSASATGVASQSNSLGRGILNAPLMVENAFGPQINGGVTAQQVLADPSRCNNALFTQHSPVSIPVCELYELTYDGTVSIPEDYELMVFEGDADNPLAAEPDNLIEGSTEAEFVFRLSSPFDTDYGVQVCKQDLSNCQGSLKPLDVATTIKCSDSESVASAKRQSVQ